jgi:hypothetical protein
MAVTAVATEQNNIVISSPSNSSASYTTDINLTDIPFLKGETVTLLSLNVCNSKLCLN